MDYYKIKKGLDINLTGEADKTVKALKQSKIYALRPADFNGITAKVLVKEGETVAAGDVLFVDKATERVRVVAPVSGTVCKVERGERRRLLSIQIEADATQRYKQFDLSALQTNQPEAIVHLLLESGLFAFLRQRPYDVVPSPEALPKAIFVSTFSSMPLAADFSFVVQGQEDDFKAGADLLARIAPLHIGVSPAQQGAAFLPKEGQRVAIACFDGKNPAGNVGVQINHVAPINKGEVVWTLGAEAVLFIGRLLRTAQVDLQRTIAVAGSEIVTPSYVQAKVGTQLSVILEQQIKTATYHQRIINGNPLVGSKSESTDFLGAYTTEVCVIPEGDDRHELFGWIMPRFDQFSVNRSYCSWLMGKKKYTLDARIKGGERHMIMSAEYEKVFPMDIYPSYLVQAIITGDIDRQEALGIYEVAPEDFAVAEFVCSSKLELQRIVREGLELLFKENA